MTKEDVLKKHKLYVANYPSTKQALNAMDEYAKHVAIEFALHICGQLKVNPNNKESYDENSNESFLIMLPTTIYKRFNLFLQSQTTQP